MPKRIPWNKGKKGVYSEETLKAMGWSKGLTKDTDKRGLWSKLGW